ncbi:MAG: RluA family pseudouridine synthase [Defluviitaleaceae bacterium]|nr:RluA family pseudouridine synthase [Defluviitaleaceae bacterium]
MKEHIVKETENNQKLNKFLGRYLNKAPKSFIHKMLRKKNITLNNSKADGSEDIKTGDIIKFFLSNETIENFKQEEKNHKKSPKLNIVYENEDMLILNKPSGLLSVPNNSPEASLIDSIGVYLKNSDFAIVNRLDKNTSGIVICGKNLHSVQKLNKLIKNREIKKYYIAIVLGTVKKAGELVGYHTKDEEKNKAKITKIEKENSKQVITRYKPLKNLTSFSGVSTNLTVLEIELVTGKAHQIRVHLAGIGHPILGDPKYGNKLINKKHKIENQLLHAYKVEIEDNIYESKPEWLY